MRAHIQRVSQASVSVAGNTIGSIEQGLLVLLGVGHGDDASSADKLLQKVLNYRVFSDDGGKMNNNVMQQQGGLLIVSQFTLMADTQKGLRPSFTPAAKPDVAEALYDYFVAQAQDIYQEDKIATGQFAADMQVSLINDGPVTFLLEV